MPIEIRVASAEELAEAHFLIAYSFTGDRSEEGRERMRHVEEMGPVLALFRHGQMAACLRVLPLAMLVNGGSIPLGGVSAVASLPELRRQGLVGQLLRHALATMRDQGQALSSLYTPHPSLYRRYGWMVASTALRYTFRPKDLAPASPSRPQGRAQRVGEEDWPALAEVYRRFTAGRNGYLDRSERWWREAVFRRLYDEHRRLNDAALWTDGAGQSRGYVTYQPSRERRPVSWPIDRLVVGDFVALDGDAHRGLLRFLLSHDLAEEVVWLGPVDDPLLLAVDDSQRLERQHHDGFMLRVVDVEKAVGARPPAAGAPEGAFTVHIADPSAPWNQGTWRIECEGGRLSARKTEETPELSTDASAFAAMYNGFLRPGEAARCGLADASDTSALALADRILAADHAPYPSDFF